jgi:hypothetical protein
MRRKILSLCCVLGVVVVLLAGCSSESRKVLLRYTPQVGSAYSYRFFINHPQMPVELPAKMQVVSKDENGYQIEFAGVSNELFPGSLIVTERHNSNHPGYISLNFPDDPVTIGDEWRGEILWYYENYYVLDSEYLYLPSSYRLLGIEQGENGRYAIIEQSVDADVAVDGLVFYVGQVGVQWDYNWKITKVYQGYDAYDELKVGDIVIGINGQHIEVPSNLSLLAEEYIQHPKQNKVVTFTVLRDGKEYDIDVEKSIDEFAVVKVYNKKDIIMIRYDIDRSILLSVDFSSSYDVAYSSPTENIFPVIDDYDGFHKFGFLSDKTTHQEHIDSNGIAWSLILDE